MSYKAFNAKKNKAKKGISPVIATVILVAVAVVIAAALAGFSSSLFGTYSSAGAAVVVTDLTLDAEGTGSLSLTNNGNVADRLVSVSIPPLEAQPFLDATLPPGEDSGPFELTLTVPENATAGKVVTVRMNFESGAQLTQSVILASAP